MHVEALDPPAYRVERTHDGLAPDTDVTLQGVATYLHETLLRHRSFEDLLQLTKEDLLTHIRNGIILVERMDIGERASNGLLQDLKWNNLNKDTPSTFGRLLDTAMNNPRLPTHNRDHLQRVEDHAVIMALNVVELRKQQELQPWLASLMLFVRWHDVDQLLSEQRNETRVKNSLPEFITKLGHGLGAATMLLALHKRYAEEANISVEDAWRVCAGAAAMILLHDNPEQFEKAVNARQPAWKWNKGHKQFLSGQELVSAFSLGNVDIFTLQPHQILELLRLTKSKQGEFMNNSLYGLHPFFEKEYRNDLKELDENKRPLLETIVENPTLYSGWRKGFMTAAEIGIRADLDDMITPPY